jgi:hypothetical protein
VDSSGLGYLHVATSKKCLAGKRCPCALLAATSDWSIALVSLYNPLTNGSLPWQQTGPLRNRQKAQLIPGIGQQDHIEQWTKDGQALLVTAASPGEAQMYRVAVPSGKKTLLQKVELSEKAGSTYNVRAYYVEDTKTYVYNTRRVLGSLYIVEGLE